MVTTRTVSQNRGRTRFRRTHEPSDDAGPLADDDRPCEREQRERDRPGDQEQRRQADAGEGDYGVGDEQRDPRQAAHELGHQNRRAAVLMLGHDPLAEPAVEHNPGRRDRAGQKRPGVKRCPPGPGMSPGDRIRTQLRRGVGDAADGEHQNRHRPEHPKTRPVRRERAAEDRSGAIPWSAGNTGHRG